MSNDPTPRRPDVQPPIRYDLIRHLVEDVIGSDPEGYVSRRLPYVVDSVVQAVRELPPAGGRRA